MSKKYEIIVNYETGDSFTTEVDQEGSLSLEWDNKKIAEENVDRVEDHYKFYCDLNSYGGRLGGLHGDPKWKGLVELNMENSTKDWAIVEWKYHSISRKQVVSGEYQEKHPEDCERIPIVSEVSLKIKGDDGKTIRQSAFWCGYFEKLSYIEVRSKIHKRRFIR